MTMSTPRRRYAVGASASAVLLGLLAGVPAAGATANRSAQSCPAPEPLTANTAWHIHTLAPGVRLYEGKAKDKGGHGVVKMKVLAVDLTQSGVAVRPLMRNVAARAPLSKLARGHKHLMAAVNTGYYDFVTGAPTQPLIVGSRPLVISQRARRVVGINTAGTLQSGSVALSGTVTIDTHRHSLGGINTVDAGGVVLFNSAWGSTRIPVGATSVARPVVSQRLGTIASRGAPTPPPTDGDELVGRDRASTWLARQPSGAPVHLSSRVVTSAATPFVQAYGVGTAVVVNGIARTGLSCDSAGTKQPARTAIGIADHGSTMVIGEVEDHPGTKLHGLDEDQMGGFMSELGVNEAFDFDGSGSTELLARMPHKSGLSLRTYPADGIERQMPVGLGITYQPPK